MANTGENILPSGNSAVLTSPVRQGLARTECVHFWYHMGGVSPGETSSPNNNQRFTMETLFNCVPHRFSECVYEAGERRASKDLL